MNYKIKNENGNYAYIQLYEQMREDITKGVFQYGDKLPSKRTIATEIQTSVITVQHAYELLSEEGYVEPRERSGYYVIYKDVDFFEGDKEVTKEIILEKVVEPQEKGEFSFNILAKTMRRVLLDYEERILVKSPNEGCIELREAITAYLARNRGIHVKTDQIIIGSGAEHLYSMVSQMFDQDCIIAVEDPCYDKIPMVYEASGYQVERLALGGDGILTSELERSQAKLLHITPFHSFPSQITASISKKREYIQWSQKGRYLIEDNYDSELTVSRKMEDAVFSLANGKRVIYMNTFSKTIAPSIRVGYMILPEDLLELYQEKVGFYSCTVPVFEQYVLCELIKSGDFERHLNRLRRRFRAQEGKTKEK